MHIVVCDDREADRALLVEYCRRYQEERRLSLTVRTFENAGGMLSGEEASLADVVFLDIYMEGASGVKASRILRSKGYQGAIIFTTTSTEHYADGYEVDAAHYLVKPVSYEAFSEAMRRALSRLGRQERTVWVNCGRSELEIPVDSIQYAEVYDHRTILHTGKGELTVSQPLSTLEKMLGGAPFLRCYRCYLINMDYVKKMNDASFLMKSGEEIPIARDGRAELKKSYMSYIFKRLEG